MGQDIKQLKELLKFIDRLSKQKGNEWFVGELINRFSNSTCKSNTKIDEIYELCIEKILREQAEMFYKDFSIQDIRTQLIEDFIRMEQFRRKNKFDEFCMALYQQIECITNRIGSEKDINDVALKLMGSPAYTDGTINNRKGEYQIAKLLFMNDSLVKSMRPVSEQYAIDKIRCIIYFVCYKAKMKSDDFNNYIEMTDLINEIYQYRNTNHRGSTPTDYQKNIYNKINPIKNFYYLKLIGVFANFIEKVNIGYPLSAELIQFANKAVAIPIKLSEPKIVGFIDLDKLKRK